MYHEESTANSFEVLSPAFCVSAAASFLGLFLSSPTAPKMLCTNAVIVGGMWRYMTERLTSSESIPVITLKLREVVLQARRRGQARRGLRPGKSVEKARSGAVDAEDF
jgi:hypothetical protein